MENNTCYYNTQFIHFNQPIIITVHKPFCTPHTELDDGAYNPLWTSRGFTQTFHFWKEHRRQQSAPLSAFLTYVTLPWWSIAKGMNNISYICVAALNSLFIGCEFFLSDLLDHRETPILTF